MSKPIFVLSNRSKERREGVDPRLIEIDDLAIKLTLVDYGHGRVAGLRADEIQNKLYLDGKSKADGYIIRGNHQAAEDGYGKALDFYAYVEGKVSYEPLHLAMVATAYFQAASILGYKIKWGGLWYTEEHSLYGWDMPHIELVED